MRKVTILALHLGYGGIERAITNIANGICDDYEVTIVSTYQIYEEPFFPLNPRIKVEYLLPHVSPNREALKKAKNHPLLLMKELNKAIHIYRLRKKAMVAYIKSCKSDIIITTRDIHNLWLSKYGRPGPIKIATEHNHHNDNQKYIRKIITSVKNLDYFVLVSKELQQFYQAKLQESSCQCIYIPNSLDELPPKISPLTQKNIISIGRLVKEKGYEDLIEVMALLHQDYPDWTLTIIGSGVLKEKLERQIEEKNLQDTITLLGFQKKEVINRFFAKSSLYVMSSYTESFGIVLLEAFAYGIPCLAFDSAQGAREIITSNRNGYLVANRNLNEMVKRIKELIAQENKRKVMGLSARRVAENYEYRVIAKEWKDLFEKAK